MTRIVVLVSALTLTGCSDRLADADGFESGRTPLHLASECMACEPADEHLCLDGKDSDEDGLTDCDDPDCAWTAGCPWKGPEDNDKACGDLLDNDGNGYTDCKDFGCQKTLPCCPNGPTAEDSNETCSNGIDDDCNGYVDCIDFSCKDICQ